VFGRPPAVPIRVFLKFKEGARLRSFGFVGRLETKGRGVLGVIGDGATGAGGGTD
jgi:hypothetical protein